MYGKQQERYEEEMEYDEDDGYENDSYDYRNVEDTDMFSIGIFDEDYE